jgi:predicted Zn-dependent protease
MSALIAKRYYQRGRMELLRGEPDTACESFRACCDLYPAFVSGRIAYAVALVRIGDCPRAAGTLRAGLARPLSKFSRAALLQTLGDVLVAGNDFFGGEDAYRQVAELFPESPSAQAGLARVTAKLGRYVDAFTALQAAARNTETLKG